MPDPDVALKTDKNAIRLVEHCPLAKPSLKDQTAAVRIEEGLAFRDDRDRQLGKLGFYVDQQ